MATSWIIPFLAGTVAAFFAAMVWKQWAQRRRYHQLAWATGLTLYAVATLLDAKVALQGWTVPDYRVFFVVAASNVGFLGLGTILLARSGEWGRLFAVFVILGTLVAAIGQFAVPLDAAQLDGTAHHIPFSQPARWAFLLLNVIGGLALIGGALLSWRQTRSRGVLLIGAGALLPFLGGSLSTIAGLDLRVLLQFLGIVVMFVGYLQGSSSAPPRDAHAPAEG